MGSIFNYNGGCVLGMSGAQCVAIACDLRLGANNFTTISTNFTKIFKMNDYVYVGLSGLATDIQTLYELLRYRVNLYEIRQETPMDIDCFANMLSSILYSNRFSPYFVNPIVVGFRVKHTMDDKGNKICTFEPYLTAYDLIGAKCETKDFVVNGVTSEQLYGMCESLYIKDQDKDGLFETISQCLLSALDRDCLSGWGAEVYVLYVYPKCISLAYSVSVNEAKRSSFISSIENAPKFTACAGGRSKSDRHSHNRNHSHKNQINASQGNVIYKQIKERGTPFRFYNIGDSFYGRILSISKKNIKLDILCDRKAYLNTSEYFRFPILHKYVFTLLKVHNIIRVKIKYIQTVHQKIAVQIQKYTYEEILSSFNNGRSLINAKILDVLDNHVLLYLAPQIHAKLLLRVGERADEYRPGNDVLVRIDRFDGPRGELYVRVP
ncbi:hypothetical protein C922_04893 [Plasmodium inui San Antonio 1]|uniref:Proteasome subunit beta type-3 n=1 Tax=Plasmodium inui San Antonio 1 TaxID=1237626 RepID=W7A6L8_9APIC|nr:hypothetical protein C922_04893 [Plasmodium inui San Antonio 1]EUD64749.1 hypothetical protein C922_04893 [Plasmodium inui San Antonio 1]